MSALPTTESAEIAASLTAETTPTLEEIARIATRRDDISDAVVAFLEPSEPQETRKARAAYMVHALGRNPDLLKGRGLAAQNKALAYIDSALSQSYRSWGIEENGEEFRRVGALAALSGQVHQSLATALEQLTSIDTIEVARNGIQRVLNTYRPMLQPLIPGPLLRSKLGELLEAVRNMNVREGSEFLAAHGRASELLAEYRAEAEQAGPVASSLLGDLINELERLVSQMYEENPATEPAVLSARPSHKKYSLGSPEGVLRLGVLVTNEGPGQALDARLEDLEADGVELQAYVVPLGQLMRGTVAATLPARSSSNEEGIALVTGTLRWQDSDGTERSRTFEAIFESQRADIDWEGLRQRYDLDAVRTARELVGRTETLRNLSDLVGERRVGSAFITGQKRVGKTSLALAFQDSLASHENVVVAYLEAGSYVRPSAGQDHL